MEIRKRQTTGKADPGENAKSGRHANPNAARSPESVADNEQPKSLKNRERRRVGKETNLHDESA
jgi:hypothetical protein